MHNQNHTERTNIKHTVSAYLIGGLFGIIAMLAVYILFAGIATVTDLAEPVLQGMVLLGLGAAGFVAGYFVAHLLGSLGLLHGLITGAILSVLFLLLCFVIFQGECTVFLVIKLAILLFLSVVGGIFGVNKKKHR